MSDRTPDAQAHEMAVEYLATSDRTGDALGIYRLTMPARRPGAGGHYHKRMVEAFEIHSGRLALFRDGQEIDAGPGDFVLVEPGIVHGFANRSDAPVVFTLTFTPALSREGYFEGLQKLARDGRLTDEVAMRELMARFDQYPVDGVAGWSEAVT